MSTPVEIPKVETPEIPEVPEGDASEQALQDFLKDEGDDLEEEDEDAVETPAVTPPEAPVVAPPAEVPPVVPAVPPVTPTQPPETPAVTPVVAPPPPAPVEPPPPTIEALRESYQRNRSEVEANLSENVYGLSEDQTKRLDEGDAKVIPELMARVYMDAVTGAVAHMVTHLPELVGNVLSGRDKGQVLEDQFYSTWPGIDKDKHAADVSRFGQAYRQIYPDAPAEDFIRDVGAQVMVALKIPPAQAAEEVPRTPPFKPARAGSSRAVPATTNVFEQLAEEMAEEELDLD